MGSTLWYPQARQARPPLCTNSPYSISLVDVSRDQASGEPEEVKTGQGHTVPALDTGVWKLCPDR